MAEKHTDPRMDQFAKECEEAGTTPEAVLQLAGLHRSAWFRWKLNGISPTLRNWDAVQAALERVRRGPDQHEAGSAAA